MDKIQEMTANGIHSATESLVSGAESRISAIIGAYPSKNAAARAAGVTAEQLSRYVKGVNRAPFDTIHRLCEPVGVSLDWVATGRAPKHAVLEREQDFNERHEILLGNLVAGLELYKERRGVALPPLTQARLVVLFFRLLSRRLESADDAGGKAEGRSELTRPETPLDIMSDGDLAAILTLVVDAVA